MAQTYEIQFAPETPPRVTFPVQIRACSDMNSRKYVKDLFDAAVAPGDEDDVTAAVLQLFHKMVEHSSNDGSSLLARIFADQQLWTYGARKGPEMYIGHSNWGYEFMADAVMVWTLETAEHLRESFAPAIAAQ